MAGKGADVAIVGAPVSTLNPNAPRAEAIAVRHGTILAVGSEAEVRSLCGPGTEVLSVRGMVVPGFQDAHCHPPFAGRDMLQVDLAGLNGLERYLATVAEYAAAHPEVPWIVGSGWSMADFPGGVASRYDLDAVVADRPVFLMNRDGHGAWVNSAALRIAGIDRDTPDPWDGRIERDAAGEPIGTLHEGAATGLRTTFVPATTAAEWEAAILAAQSNLFGFGVTTVQDAWVEAGTLRAYHALAERGELKLGVVAALWWDRDAGRSQIPALQELRRWGTAGRIDAGTVKIMLDGVAENFTAALTDPYLDGHGAPTANAGKLFVDPEELKEAVTLLDADGFQVHMHAIGDRAVRSGLDAVEAAQLVNGRRDARHHIAHLQVIDPVDIPRFGQLGVLANCQPYWACNSAQVVELTNPFLGPERARWQYPFGALQRAGAELAFGSDWKVSTPNPLLEMEVAVTRVSPRDRGAEPLLPEQRVSLAEALRAFTMGSARANRREQRTGSIEVGKDADLVVLDRNLFEVAPAAIGDVSVRTTMVRGEVVFEACG